MCRKSNFHNEPSYNYEDIKPFLCKPSVNQGRLLHGEAMYDTGINEDGTYLYHVTNFGNFKNIIEKGLKCSKGGTGGAGEIMAGGKFKKHESGYLFATSSPKIVDKYVFNYDELSDNDLTRIDLIPILLRFKPYSDEIWITDIKQKDAVKGKNNIESARLEFLCFEGWVSLRTKSARDTIVSIINDISGLPPQ